MGSIICISAACIPRSRKDASIDIDATDPFYYFSALHFAQCFDIQQ